MTFKKGNRVEWNETPTEIRHGTVVQVKAKANRMVVTVDGATHNIEGPITAFRHTNVPIPTDTIPTEMDRYAVKKFKSVQGRDGYAFSASIYRDDHHIAEVINAGCGGPNKYYPVGSESVASLHQLFVDTEAWCRTFGYANPIIKAADLWVEWYVDARNYGVTGEMYVQDILREIPKNILKHDPCDTEDEANKYIDRMDKAADVAYEYQQKW